MATEKIDFKKRYSERMEYDRFEFTPYIYASKASEGKWVIFQNLSKKLDGWTIVYGEGKKIIRRKFRASLPIAYETYESYVGREGWIIEYGAKAEKAYKTLVEGKSPKPPAGKPARDATPPHDDLEFATHTYIYGKKKSPGETGWVVFRRREGTGRESLWYVYGKIAYTKAGKTDYRYIFGLGDPGLSNYKAWSIYKECKLNDYTFVFNSAAKKAWDTVMSLERSTGHGWKWDPFMSGKSKTTTTTSKKASASKKPSATKKTATRKTPARK